ncbi:nicotinate-nucleotide--dimethylbenzimidazole phosphoribosyltransferase [Streptomyces sp. NPDC051320]|uniref:nicotinate-nucleotide--dimethylbenzimidazole phosphoribosyltransferase n=1 Tax=Streptomyces sp. NPDC051320 TaxID=3154644 RepID=UPI00341E5D34
MTDTGQVPAEGLPENAGMVEQPGIPAPGAYTYLDPSENPAEDDDLLLMPGAQGAWSEPQSQFDPQSQFEPQSQFDPQSPLEQRRPLEAQAPLDPRTAEAAAPAPEPGAHETGGRDTGAVDLGAVRTPVQAPPAAAPPQRRPLHMGPPVPDTTGGVVRSLADRGPTATPARPVPVQDNGPQTMGPEYLDFSCEDAAALPGPQLGEIPPQAAMEWNPLPPPAAPGRLEADPVPHPAESAEPGVSGPPVAPTGAEPPVDAAYPAATPHAPAAAAPAASAVPAGAAPTAAGPDSPGGFVPVEGSLPSAPHLAPAPVAMTAAPAEALPLPEHIDSADAAPAPAEPQPAEPEPSAGSLAEPTAAPVEESATPASAAAEPEPEAGPAETEATAIDAAAAVPPALEAEPPAAQPTPESAPEPSAAAPAASVEPPAPDAVPVPDVVPIQSGEQRPGPAAVAVPAPRHGGSSAQPQAAEEPEGPPEALASPLQEQEPQPATPLDVDPVAAVAETATAPESPAAPELDTPQEPVTAPEAVSEPETEPEAAPQPTASQPTASQPTASQSPAPADQQAAAEPAPAAAPAYEDAEREAVLRVMRERRDIRNGFRSDPIPHEVLLRVLEAAHTAPSVGHSQPWDFVVIRSAETRRSMHELAQRQRETYLKSLPKARAKQFKELKIEAILDTPVNIVVTADPTRGGRHTLGRHTQPQMAPYSSALAVENLWLAARAEGLGVGWVSFFDEREMVRALGLPEHLEVVAYLCVGYVDEFPEEPELMQAGWSKRRPLSWVVHEETYGRRALPGEEPHDLLQETITNIRPLDAKALGEAWERQKRMTKPAGALGMLEIISAQLSGLSRMCPPPVPEPAAVAIFAGDHGVHAQGVTAWPQEVTSQMVANFLGGGAVCNAFANQVGAEVCVVDVGVVGELPATPGLLPRKVRAGTADFTTGPALSREEVLAAIEVGIETARDLVAAGNKGLLTGEMGIANTTVSAALICVYTGLDPAEVTGRGTGINDEMHARKVDVVRRGLELHHPDPTDPVGVLAAVGGLEHAALVGFLLGGASLRTPVILDGVSAGAAALVARAIAPEALAACIAGHRSAEPGHVATLNKLGLRPLVDLDLRLGEGTGALLALPVVQSAARAMHEVATFDSAGVTEK